MIPVQVSLFLMLAVAACNRQDPPTAYNPNPYRTFDFDASWSPDGRLIAYTRSARDPSYVGGVWVVSPDGGQPDSVRVYSDTPSWSWDNRYLAMFDFRDRQIHVHEAGTWLEIASTSGPGNHLNPRWHPDNERIFYNISGVPDSLFGIWQFDILTGESSRFLAVNGAHPAPDPTGAYLIYRTGSRLWRADLQSGETTTLIHFDTYGPGPANANIPQFSPDGTRILFWSSGKFNYDVQGIWEFTLADSSLTRLTGNARDPAYSATGDSIVYSAQLPDDETGAGLLWILDKNTGERWQLTILHPWRGGDLR